MNKSYQTSCPEETERIAGEIASEMKPGSVIALYGDLGAGKTVFARGFARALGITEPVGSPTFTIVQEYVFPDGRLYHLDLYRIDNANAALAFGVDEFLYDKHAISLVEWPERIEEILPENVLRIRLEYTEQPTIRRIAIL